MVRSGKGERTRFSNTGYGTGEGLGGWNCRHSFGSGDGVNNPYKDIQTADNVKMEKLEQRQRALERRIRKTKREVMGICNMKKMCGEWENDTVAEVAEDLVKKYSNGRYDHNIDSLYDAYLAAKEAYHTNGDQAHRDKLMETVGRLMVEVYDMLSSMVVDSDFQEERREIQRQIQKLAET